MSGHEPEKPRRPPERPVDPGEDPEASSDPDYSSDPDTTGYRDPTGDPNAPSQSPVASGDTHEEPGEDQPSRTPDDPFSADNQGSDPLPDVKTRSRGGPAIGRQPDGTVQTVTLPSAMDRTKIVDQSLKNSQPDEAPLRALLDTYQQSLTEKGSPDVRSVPDRYEVLSDYVARDFATREADAGQKSAQQQVFDTISWLRVSGTAKMPQIDQSVRHQLHTVVTLLFELKAQQKPFEFVFPGEGPLHAEP